MKKNSNELNGLSRRDFMKASTLTAGGLLMGSLPVARSAYAAGSDTLKVALIGCGDRGTGAAFNTLMADDGVELVAMADILEDRLNNSYNTIMQRFGETGKVNVPDEHKFVGFDAYKKAIPLADVVLLTTPTFFRPVMYAEAVRLGKHVFMEKPVAVDAAGVRSVLESGKIAEQKGLNVVVGLQRRYEMKYRELHRRLQNGEIGDLVSGQVYWNQGPFFFRPRQPEWSELEHQIRNHFHFIWVAGDQVLDQMIHNLDVANWYIGAHPVSAMGMGGRETRTSSDYGQIFDHSSIEYVYPDGTVLQAQCRQQENVHVIINERFNGTRGFLSTGGPEGPVIRDRAKNVRFRYEGQNDPSPYNHEHVELYRAIRGQLPRIDDSQSGAEASMTSILGMMTVYSGDLLTWDDALASNIKMYPDHDMDAATMNWDTVPPARPDANGDYQVPVVGHAKVL